MHPNPWFLVPRPLAEPRKRLFCFPHAGASATAFHSWSRLLPADMELRALQLPGRTYRFSEPNIVDMGELLDRAHEAIAPFLDRPFLFFGHSMGALIAFELARRVRSAPLEHLVVSGRRAPQLPTGVPPLHQLDDATFRNELERIFGMPRALLDDPALMAPAMPALRADFAAMEGWSYAPAAPLDVRMTALGGREDLGLRPGDIEAWQEQTTGRFASRWFDGAHFFLNQRPADIVAVLED
ncbi:MAG TPA: alpha/beta fold hydrolase [Thermoanaerobaculia bacterium]|nr:alpha/beta fold hydrolase [Thermoanaerobaculia bacterium]